MIFSFFRLTSIRSRVSIYFNWMWTSNNQIFKGQRKCWVVTLGAVIFYAQKISNLMKPQNLVV